MRFPFYKQPDIMDCGPTCLRMISKFYGRSFSLEKLRNLSGFNKEGVSLLGISEAAENIGFKTRGVKLNLQELINETSLPVILHWDQNHFIVLISVSSNKKSVLIADPGSSILKLSIKDFEKRWIQISKESESEGIALLLEPMPAFYNQDDEKEVSFGWRSLYAYLLNYKKYLFHISIGLLLGSLIQLVLPFLTQSVIDSGIRFKNLHFITIIILAQSALIISRTLVDFIRTRILLFISTHINIAILSDFWIKLLKLPLGFFDTKQTGDILQRINDHQRIEQFLTGTTLEVLFSVINLLIFSVVLLMYNVKVFLIFIIGSVLYFIWIRFFLQRRRILNYKTFDAASKENSATLQLVYGMQEIKLNNAEQSLRWKWENLQASLFKLSFKSLSLSQYQQAGAVFINEGKNLFITYVVATAVVQGQLTLGALLAIQYIIGQLNGPVEQLVGFTQQAQDAKISFERLNEIHSKEDEEPAENSFIKQLPADKSIIIRNLTFTYSGAGNEPVLKNLNVTFPAGKTTAIVGMSGSGKTTLLKLLLRFYESYTGTIQVGDIDFKNISPKFWRMQCGSVMQDGYIFNDNIANNIGVSDDVLDNKKLEGACTISNLTEFIESLPLKFNTNIGNEGNGISQGQKQRILIARAVYKSPAYIFFDEATNSLDANNEKVIIENLKNFFAGKTVIVVAHRLSTVKNADNIIVLEKGVISEQGTHNELSLKKGKYYELVKNQLELGN